MFDLLFISSVVGSTVQAIKEKCSHTIPADNWNNKDLYYEDVMNGVPIEQRMKNLENGRYKMVKSHPEPHRDPVTGKIVIENCELYHEDVKNYGAYKAQQWMEQGKYNLSTEELKKEEERIEAKYKYLFSL